MPGQADSEFARTTYLEGSIYFVSLASYRDFLFGGNELSGERRDEI